MGDPESDPEPLPDSALAGALGRAEAAGLLAVHDAYAADLVGYAEFLLAACPADTGTHVADEAAGAVLDALLVGTVAIADLPDPARFRTWLLALTRNECLRRRPGAAIVPADEAAELGRRGLRSAEVALLLGFAPVALPRRVPAREAAPCWLRTGLAAAGGPDGAGRRAELARRARPFDQDGFPVPLDRRRLSGKVLAWSVAAVVLVAAGVLVAVPTGGDAAAVGGTGPMLAAASSAAALPGTAPTEEDPLPTLAATPFGAGDSAAPDPDAGRPTTPTAGPSGTGPSVGSAPPTRADGGARAERPSRGDDRAGAVALTWAPLDGLRCGGEWTARLYATTGGAEVSSVVAIAGGQGPVPLRRDGDGWSGALSGLPTDRPVVVTVRADGGVRPTTSKLSSYC